MQVQLKTSKQPKEGSKLGKGGKWPRGQSGRDANEKVTPTTKKRKAANPRQAEGVAPEDAQQQQEADDKPQAAPQPEAAPVEGSPQPEAAAAALLHNISVPDGTEQGS